MDYNDWNQLKEKLYSSQLKDGHEAAVWALSSALEESMENIKKLINGEDWCGFDEEFRFYKNYDEEEKKEEPEFDGIRYSVDVESLEDPVVLSYEETLYYLEIIAERYIKCNPESKEQIEKLMQQYKDTYHL